MKFGGFNIEIYILGGFNIDLYLNDSYFWDNMNIISSKSIPSDVKSCQEFCTFFWIKTIKVPTRITSGSPTVIDHILASYPERITQHGAIDIGLSSH